MTENELATIAVDICFQIHQKLDPGLLESVYEAAFVHEVEKRIVAFSRQQGIIANYDEVILDVGFRADIIMKTNSSSKSNRWSGLKKFITKQY